MCRHLGHIDVSAAGYTRQGALVKQPQPAHTQSHQSQFSDSDNRTRGGGGGGRKAWSRMVFAATVAGLAARQTSYLTKRGLHAHFGGIWEQGALHLPPSCGLYYVAEHFS